MYPGPYIFAQRRAYHDSVTYIIQIHVVTIMRNITEQIFI